MGEWVKSSMGLQSPPGSQLTSYPQSHCNYMADELAQLMHSSTEKKFYISYIGLRQRISVECEMELKPPQPHLHVIWTRYVAMYHRVMLASHHQTPIYMDNNINHKLIEVPCLT